MLLAARIGLAGIGALTIGLALFVLVLAILIGGPITADAGLNIALSLVAALCFGAGMFFIRIAITAGRNRPTRKPTKEFTLPRSVTLALLLAVLGGFLLIEHYFPASIRGNLTLSHVYLGTIAIALAFLKWGKSFFAA